MNQHLNNNSAAEVPWNVQGQLPQVPRAEQALLSLMTTHPDEVMKAGMLSGLCADCFYIPAHAIVWEALATRYNEGRRTDDVEGLVSALALSGQLDKVGGFIGLSDILNGSNTSVLFLKDRMAEVMQAYRARLFILRAPSAETGRRRSCPLIESRWKGFGALC